MQPSLEELSMNGTAVKPPTAAQIAFLAYLIREIEGRPQGRMAAHYWRQAEKQLHADWIHENGGALQSGRPRSIHQKIAIAPQFKKRQEAAI